MGDHKISYRWRNNPEIWKLTGARPDIVVTEAIEESWLQNVLKQENTMRFAICISSTDEYVGNVQLTNIENGEAEFHIFIGETQYWGKGVATKAMKLITEEGFKSGLHKIYLFVKKENKPAIAVYLKCGFQIESEDEHEVKMAIGKAAQQ